MEVQVAGLRCLGCLCSVGEGVGSLLEERGLALVLGVLGEEGRGEGERREAAGVLAQVTSPWVEEATCLTALTAHLTTILASLTNLAVSTSSMETFLLCMAALANLTSLVAAAPPLLLSSGRVPALLAHPAAASSSPYIHDQLVTLVANMARLPLAREEMVEAGALSLLLAILSHAPVPDPALAQARERSLSKAAIALARLALDQATAEEAVRLGAMDTLARLTLRESQVTTAAITHPGMGSVNAQIHLILKV